MGINEFKDALEVIGWSITDSPNGLNHFIKNNFNERTALRVSTLNPKQDETNYIQLCFANKGMWGEKGAGSLQIPFDNLHVEVHECKETVSLYHVFDNKKPSMFISFYNHEKYSKS